MRRTFARVRVLAAAAATAVLVHTTAAQALGMGEINVDSLLNQRFSATIPLYEIDAEDLETLSLSLAPAEAFDRAGLERSDYLSSLEFVIKNDQGRPRVLVSSSQIAHEPVMNLLVQARWAGGKLMREYTVLLDPPQLALPAASKPAKPVPAPQSVTALPPPAPLPTPASAPVVAAKPLPPPPAPVVASKPLPPPAKPDNEFYQTSTETSQAPVSKPAPVRKPELRPAVAAPAAAVPPPAPSGASFGPVKSQDTLWSIATRLRPDASVSMDQVMYALALANPKTIQRGTTVNKGAMLNVPALEAIQAQTPAEAKAGLAALRQSGAPAAKPESKPVPPAPTPAVKPAAAPPAATEKAPASKPEKPVGSASVTAVVPPAAAPAVKTPEPAAPPTAAAPAKPLVKSVAEAFPSASKPEPAKPASSVSTPAPAPAPAPASKIEPVPSKIIAAPTAAPAEAAGPEAKPESPAAKPAETAAAPTATEATPASEPTAVAATPPPAVSPPKLAQTVPAEEDEGGILELLSAYALPLGGLLALVLIGLVGSRVLSTRRGGKRRSSRRESESARAAAVASVAGAAAANRLGDTQVDATRTNPADFEQTQAITQQLDGGAAGGKPSAFESTLIIEPAMAATLQNAAAATQVGQKKTDFDMTTQMQAETLHINLDANDPISEADFHLAYGLYDEAILLLKQALGKTPDRDDVRVKLAETYFAAGKPMEFQLLAEELKPRLSPAEWGKIAIMGSQLCPGVALFKSDAGAELAADFDLGFDDSDLSLPPEPIHSIPTAVSPAPSSSLPPPPIASEAPSLDLAPLDLPEVSIPPLSALKPDVPPVEFNLELDPALVGDVKDIPQEDPDSIDFMLGQSITPLGAASAAPPPALDSNLLEFDLDGSMNPAPGNAKVKTPGVVDELPGLDFQLSLAGDAPQSSLAPAARAQPEPELDLADFEISLTPRELDAGSVEDEFNTKLDLARAYVEMGDNEMARGLLQEVQQQGNAAQKSEASGLLERLPA
ncbi:hypothetical protein ED208_16630 [Stagnimonas aquatica]|uniref:LysM domain-containing protein n=1 Tax=Stagnimonas aquatica TaxID=2689987 RepID=A0A3N0UYK2_9GAMM|nr:FimV/HubP family polar landmark protein [Stagnimonas aquatica]ROH85636.1 hypothetical protein ED208_16630 [Stagnimonas aquatica]